MRMGFFGLGISLFALAFNLYAAWWLVRRLALGPLGRLLVIEAALLASALYPAARGAGAWLPAGAADFLLWLGFFAVGASLILFWWLAVCDLLLALFRALGLRALAGRRSAAACAAFGVLRVAYAVYLGRRAPEIARLDVEVSGLPAALDGFTVLQVSDLHLGRMAGVERLEKIAAAAAAEKPDLVAFTGDFSERREAMPPGVCEVLRGMYAKRGKYAVLGNHDMFSGGDTAAAFFEDCGVTMLRGRAVEAAPGLLAAGVDDLRRGDPDGARKLAAVLDRSKPLLFLTHQPRGFEAITAEGSGLVLAGHTHNGQIFPFNLVERALYEYSYGFYAAGRYGVYVTAGAGTWGPPMRLFRGSELPLLRLRVPRGR